MESIYAQVSCVSYTNMSQWREGIIVYDAPSHSSNIQKLEIVCIPKVCFISVDWTPEFSYSPHISQLEVI